MARLVSAYPRSVSRPLSVVTLLTMPPLAIANARIGEKLGSSATKS